MKIDIHCLTDGSRGKLKQGKWGDARETACLMSALTGETSIEGCTAQGWPKWLAELGTVIFDSAPEDKMLERAVGFAEAVNAAEERGADWDEVFRAFRLDSVLPIALDAIGKGDEDWRVACREVVQWSIDNGGVANPRAADAVHSVDAAWAAWVAKTTGAVGAAWAVGAARAAWAAEAEGAAGAASAASAARDKSSAHTRIYESICRVLKGEVS